MPLEHTNALIGAMEVGESRIFCIPSYWQRYRMNYRHAFMRVAHIARRGLADAM